MVPAFMCIYMGCCTCLEVICGKGGRDLTTLKPLTVIKKYFWKILIPWYLINRNRNFKRRRSTVNKWRDSIVNKESHAPPCHKKRTLSGVGDKRWPVVLTNDKYKWWQNNVTNGNILWRNGKQNLFLPNDRSKRETWVTVVVSFLICFLT